MISEHVYTRAMMHARVLIRGLMDGTSPPDIL
jgi:hypothetical protein